MPQTQEFARQQFLDKLIRLDPDDIEGVNAILRVRTTSDRTLNVYNENASTLEEVNKLIEVLTEVRDRLAEKAN